MLSEKLEFSLANNSSIAELEFTFSFNLTKKGRCIKEMNEEILNIFTKRRSIRSFTNQPVEQD